jgi:general secretion pathway protein J
MTFSRRGFTLVEVMIALTLLGLAAALLTSGTRLALDVSSRGAAKAESLRREKIERDLLRGQLRGALPFQYWTNENRRIEHLAFEGEADHIRFVSRDGILDGPETLPRWVDLRRQALLNGESKLVVEERRILPPDNLPGDIPTARVEMFNCADLRFGYLDTSGDKPQWSSQWDTAEVKMPLPAAIRLQCKTRTDSTDWLIPLDYSDAARQGVRFQ